MPLPTHWNATFATEAEREEAFAAMGFRAYGEKTFYTHVAHGFDDDGRKTITFARRTLGDRLTWQFAEQFMLEAA